MLWVIINYLFSYDVTKMYTKELSILLSFCFHGVLEQLKRYMLTNFLFINVLCFVVEYAWIFLSEQSSYSVLENLLLFRSSLRDEFTLLWQNSVTDVSVGSRPQRCNPLEVHQRGFSTVIYILGEISLQIFGIEKILCTSILGRVFAYLASILSGFRTIYWTIVIYIFDGVTQWNQQLIWLMTCQRA